MKLLVIWPGKTKNQYLHHVEQEYCKKIEKMIRFQLVQVKENKLSPERRLREEKKLIEEKIPLSSFVAVLDSKGRHYTTQDLLRRVTGLMNSSYKNLVFVMGSHSGLHKDVVNKADLAMALSAMDLPHELCRVILLEQIYRVLCYVHNIPYPK